jgi:hypothetical protein
MPISTEDTILAALKTGLETISIANGYQTNLAEAIESPAVLADVPNRPAVYFYCDRDTRENFAYGWSARQLHIWLQGYVDSPQGNWEPLRKLKADIIELLESATNWTYQEFTEIISWANYFAGIDKEIAVVMGEITIDYQHQFAAP